MAELGRWFDNDEKYWGENRMRLEMCFQKIVKSSNKGKRKCLTLSDCEKVC